MLTLVHEPAVDLKLVKAEDRWDRAILVWELATYTLARDPEVGKVMTESGKTRSFTYPGAYSVGQPALTIVYEIAVTQIIVHDVMFEDAKNARIGHG